ncbi:MAG: ComF family protein [Sedimentisphaerales bacterium]|jgi:ComF family protein
MITAPNRTSNWFARAISDTVGGLGQLLWPAKCVNCGRHSVETGNVLCGDCWEGLTSVCSADYCRRCDKDVSPYAVCEGVCPNCRGEEIGFDGIARAGRYAESLQDMILAFKKDKTELDSIMVWLADTALQTSTFFQDIDFFVPVPLHWRRRFHRGYNQSYLLAKGLKHPSAKVSDDFVRIRYTKRQPEMPSFAARQKNVAGAFAVRYRHPFAGKKICLVDDIKTTGATLNECAKTLKEAGASKVFALVLSVAGQDAR